MKSGGVVQDIFEPPVSDDAESSRLDRLFGTQPESPIEIFEDPSPRPAAPADLSSPALRTTPAPMPPISPLAPMPPMSSESLLNGTVPSLQQAIDSGACTPESMHSMTWNQYYGQRMNSVLHGHQNGQDHWLLQWWHSNSEAFRANHQQIVRHVGHSVSSAALETKANARKYKAIVRQYVDDHTMPPQFVPDVDVYDSRPRTVALGPVRTVSADDLQPESRIARLTRDITTIQPTLGYALKGIEADQLPSDFYDKLDNGEYVARQSSPMVMQWAPTNLYHYPLYFEDPALERYGHTYHPLIQPFASTGRFATQLVGLPYQMTLHPVHAHEYTLGWYRPGDFAPKKLYQIPFNEEAALMQAAVIAGMILIFP